MFIDVDKIAEVKAKDDQGKEITFEKNGRDYPIIEDYNIFKETIRIEDIKSARPWDKNKIQREKLDGAVTLLYLKGNPRKDTPAQMLILESHEEFSKRVNSIQTNG